MFENIIMFIKIPHHTYSIFSYRNFDTNGSMTVVCVCACFAQYIAETLFIIWKDTCLYSK